MTLKTFILIFLVFNVILSDELYKKIIHTTDPDALCLDGTPPLLYLHEGAEKTKFLIFFVGGGVCTGMSLE